MSLIPLGQIIGPAKVMRSADPELPVLSVTRHKGLVEQDSVFNKQIAGRDKSKYLVVSPHQLVVGIHIDEGALAVSNDRQRGIVSPAYKVWDIKEPDSICSSYLNKIIRSPQAVSYFASHYRQTAHRRGKIRKEDFLALSIHLPPLPEQKRIAAILDAADALRAKRRESIEQLDSLIQSTFLEMFGDPVTNPKGWQIDTLQNHGSLKNGLNFSSSESGNQLLCLGVGDFKSRWCVDDVTSLPAIKLNSVPSTEYLLQDGDLVFVRSNGNRALVGRCVVIYPRNLSVTFSGFCIRYRPESMELDSVYLARLFRSDSMKSAILGGGRGANIQNINQRVLNALPVPRPPKELQQRFASIVESIEQQKNRLKAHLDELDTLFASLQSRAFNGELVA